ncbi:MAG: SpoIID/LytB domain-containing protein, partial [Proteocatella sp.]
VYISSSGCSSYSEAEIMSETYGSEGLVCYKDGKYYYGSFKSENGLDEISEGGKVLLVLGDGRNIVIDGSQNMYIKSDDVATQLENIKYRGKINLYVKASKLHAINELGMQDYLYGVIPKEMVSSWEIEALKAQAVVAKSYTITNYNKHRSDGFNVCATTHCQMYGGYGAEQAKTNESVDETENFVMMYDGKPAEGYFHASSGGRTESIGNMWNYGLDYMVGVEDEYSLGSPYDSWEVRLSAEEIRASLLKKNIDIGSIVGVKILKLSENSRVMQLGVLGTKGMHTLEKDAIRSALGSSQFKSTYFTLKDSGSSVNSGSVIGGSKAVISNSNLNNKFDKLNRFVDARVMDSSQKFISGGTFVFSGKGNGHGIGLSQYGANGMAKKGYGFEDIIKHYFKGVSI